MFVLIRRHAVIAPEPGSVWAFYLSAIIKENPDILSRGIAIAGVYTLMVYALIF
jgi:hypothetical protein